MPPIPTLLAPLALAVLAPFAALAGEADVVGATARQTGGGAWTVSATIRHADAGWDHYADGFDVLGEDGILLGTRPLLHPHETEQPFTRSLTGLRIPDRVQRITVRAHDKVHGHGGAEISLDLER